MHNRSQAGCVLMPCLGGKLAQNHGKKIAHDSRLTTATTRRVTTAVRKYALIPLFCSYISSSLSTAIQSIFPDQTSSLYPLSTGPTISTDKLILSIVERSC